MCVYKCWFCTDVLVMTIESCRLEFLGFPPNKPRPMITLGFEFFSLFALVLVLSTEGLDFIIFRCSECVISIINTCNLFCCNTCSGTSVYYKKLDAPLLRRKKEPGTQFSHQNISRQEASDFSRQKAPKCSHHGHHLGGTSFCSFS